MPIIERPGGPRTVYRGEANWITDQVTMRLEEASALADYEHTDAMGAGPLPNVPAKWLPKITVRRIGPAPQIGGRAPEYAHRIDDLDA